jgi:hypothetical protein
MIDYDFINKNFGAPLNTVNIPHIPLKLKKWHVVLGVCVVGLAAFGGYKLYENYIKDSKKYDE